MNLIPTFLNGIPLHPLVVHAAVIMLPLAAFLAIFLTFTKKARNAYSYAALLGLTIMGTVSTVLAEQTGEKLAEVVGYPGEHSEFGETATKLAIAFMLFTIAWVISYKAKLNRLGFISALRNTLAALVSILGVVLTVSIYFAGHSGAAVTWENRLAEVAQSQTAQEVEADSDSDSANGAESSDATADSSDVVEEPSEPAVEANYNVALSAELLSTHFNTPDFCWTVIDNRVYDLTRYISDHPGGEAQILSLCGIDGTAAFNGKHGGEPSPTATLNNYEITEFGVEIDVRNFNVPQSLIDSLASINQ